MEDVQGLLKRPKLYDNIDGSSELMLGCMMIGFTAFQWVGAHTPQESFWNKVYALYIFVALLITALIYGRNTLKNLVTYRRTGFVRYRKPNPRWLGLICLLAASIACAVAFFTLRKREIDTTLLLTIGIGLLLTATYAYGIARAIRWKWIVAVLLMVSAIVIALLPGALASAPMSQPWLPAAFNRRFLGSLFWYEASYGVILVISGCVSLGLYLHGTHRAERE